MLMLNVPQNVLRILNYFHGKKINHQQNINDNILFILNLLTIGLRSGW